MVRLKDMGVSGHQASSPFAIETAFYLYAAEGDSIRVSDILLRRPYTLFIFFSPTDCPSCLQEKRYWNLLSCYDSLAVFGALVCEKVGDAERAWLENLQVSFPVYFDVGGKFYSHLGKFVEEAQRPLKALCNRRGIVVMKGGHQPDYAKQWNWSAEVAAFLIKDAYQ